MPKKRKKPNWFSSDRPKPPPPADRESQINKNLGFKKTSSMSQVTNYVIRYVKEKYGIEFEKFRSFPDEVVLLSKEKKGIQRRYRLTITEKVGFDRYALKLDEIDLERSLKWNRPEYVPVAREIIRVKKKPSKKKKK